ncbi:MAG: stage III sporulation protein AF [Lachnospiraceae bacterium]|nr:stage III sporulation protein AF [Lachnospiraceae bacterium]
MLDLIRTAGVFMIIAQTLYHFVSGSKYARYVRLLIRIMTLAVLIVPLLDLIKSGAKEDFGERLDRFEREYEAILQGAEYTGGTLVEERIEQVTAQELMAMVDPVLAPYGYETVSVYADESGLQFALRSFFGREGGEIEVRPVREIHIQVGEPEGEENEEQSGQSEGQDTESELAGVIAAYLRVERSWVEVSIIE